MPGRTTPAEFVLFAGILDSLQVQVDAAIALRAHLLAACREIVTAALRKPGRMSPRHESKVGARTPACGLEPIWPTRENPMRQERP